MKRTNTRSRTRPIYPKSEIAELLSQKLVGQPAAIDAIVPYIQMHQAGLAPEGRPAGVFLLMGPTGTGKTKTVEALAEVLHGNPHKLLKVDCGEFQMEHEVAKLVGAPPGYLGHRETQPILTQAKINGATTEACDLSIILFDEIEKAAPSMTRLLLGILDKAILRLGDNTTVNFEKTVIFLTSNLGARAMAQEIHPSFGFEGLVARQESAVRVPKLERIGLTAVRKKFAPEFVNRIDAIVTYQPLDQAAMAAILDQQLLDLQDHIDSRLGARAFLIDVPARSRRWLLKMGTSDEYGARELKRTLQRQLIQPLATLVAQGEIMPNAYVRVEVAKPGDRLFIRIEDPSEDEEELRPAC